MLNVIGAILRIMGQLFALFIDLGKDGQGDLTIPHSRGSAS